jgi:hypothetical protein
MMKWLVSALAAILLVSPTGAHSSQIPHELFNYGRQWNVWSDTARLTYLEGFVDGQSSTYATVEADLPASRREAIKIQTFTFYASSSLRDVMTSIYSDPANTYIRYDSVLYLSRDKLNGKDIEPMLLRAREQDRGFIK